MEHVVIDATYKALASPELIEDIAARIMGVHKKRMEDQSMINILQERLAEKESAINNLIIAMEQGIISSTTKDRLNNLESEKADLINKIAVEKARASLLIQKEDIVKYLQNAVKKRPLQMIQLIIKQVVLYNDKIEIHLNYTDGKRPDEEDRQAFSFYSLTQRVEIDTHKIGRDPIVTDYKIDLLI